MKLVTQIQVVLVATFFLLLNPGLADSGSLKENIYNPGKLKPIDSTLKVKVGEVAPDFTLPADRSLLTATMPMPRLPVGMPAGKLPNLRVVPMK